MKRALGIATVLFLLGAVMLLGIAMVLFLVGAVTLIEGCSNGKDPQEKEEPAVEKVTSVSNEKDITKEPTKKESSGKEEITDLGKDVKLEMILIPAGKFVMGSPASEKGHRVNETQHEVTLTKPFYMGKHEVTQDQWDAVMVNNRSFYRGPKLPVTSVSWENCQEFIKKLNAKTSGGYRLPTEAEWEYSCRAGTATAYSNGDIITKNDSNVEGLSTKVVGSYKPNAFGLYDMHGNVWEWCEDWKVDYPKEAVIDPKGPEAGKNRVLRGGSFTGVGLHSRSANWFDNLPSTWNIDYLGFRLAKTK